MDMVAYRASASYQTSDGEISIPSATEINGEPVWAEMLRRMADLSLVYVTFNDVDSWHIWIAWGSDTMEAKEFQKIVPVTDDGENPMEFTSYPAALRVAIGMASLCVCSSGGCRPLRPGLVVHRDSGQQILDSSTWCTPAGTPCGFRQTSSRHLSARHPNMTDGKVVTELPFGKRREPKPPKHKHTDDVVQVKRGEIRGTLLKLYKCSECGNEHWETETELWGRAITSIAEIATHMHHTPGTHPRVPEQGRMSTTAQGRQADDGLGTDLQDC